MSLINCTLQSNNVKVTDLVVYKIIFYISNLNFDFNFSSISYPREIRNDNVINKEIFV